MNWKTKKSYTFTKNLRWFSTATTKYYLPMNGSLSEQASATNAEANFVASNTGRASKMSFLFDLNPGSTILTIEDEVAGTLGTKTFTGSTSLFVFNFPDDLDTGTNDFDGAGRLRIGLHTTNGVNTANAAITFDIDL